MKSGSSKKPAPAPAEPNVLKTAPTSVAEPSAGARARAMDSDEGSTSSLLAASNTSEPRRRRAALGY